MLIRPFNGRDSLLLIEALLLACQRNAEPESSTAAHEAARGNDPDLKMSGSLSLTTQPGDR